MNHLAGWKILLKDQARRLRFQEQQRIQSKVMKAHNSKRMFNDPLTQGQLKTFASKLVK